MPIPPRPLVAALIGFGSACSALAQTSDPGARINEALQLVAHEQWERASPLLAALDSLPVPVPVRAGLDVARARADFARDCDRPDGWQQLEPARERLGKSFQAILQTLLDESLTPKETDLLHRIAVEVVRESAEIPLWFGKVNEARTLLASCARRFAGQMAGVSLDRILQQLDWTGQSVGDIEGPGYGGGSVKRPAQGIQIVLFWTPADDRSRWEFRYVNDLVRKWGPQGLQATGICIAESNRKDRLDKFLRENPVKWPQIRDPRAWDSPLVQRLGIHRTGAPQMLLLDSGRVMRANLWGFYGRQWVARALKVTGSPR